MKNKTIYYPNKINIESSTNDNSIFIKVYEDFPNTNKDSDYMELSFSFFNNEDLISKNIDYKNILNQKNNEFFESILGISAINSHLVLLEKINVFGSFSNLSIKPGLSKAFDSILKNNSMCFFNKDNLIFYSDNYIKDKDAIKDYFLNLGLVKIPTVISKIKASDKTFFAVTQKTLNKDFVLKENLESTFRLDF